MTGKTKSKAKGIICESNRSYRKVDRLSRISLPKELRNSFGISIGDPIEMYYDGDLIYMKKYTPECFFCESMENVKEYRNTYICKKCLEALRKL